MVAPKEERWTGKKAEESFQEFDNARKPVLRATQKLLSELCDEYFDGDETVLEIGAGKGFLERNWPKGYHGTWIQLDREYSLLQHSKGMRVAASAYKTPLPDKSVDVLCGYGSFDVLYNLEDAVKEARRVLKDTGFFFHLLDLEPNREAIVANLKKKKKCHFPEDLGLIEVIPDEMAKAYKKAQKRNVSLKKGRKNDWKIREEHGSYFLDQHEYFRKRLAEALESHFRTVVSGTKGAYFVGPKLGHHIGSGNQFGLLSGSISTLFYGTKYGRLSKNLPINHCVEVSEMEFVMTQYPI